ncbi:hypothetical protein [Pseudomonas sp. IT-P294]|uniref:hypothetical protein n=1 Tax=Pseudomonas sp. IT-P294 TaxID=3026454 RepID=UPI0039E0CDB5
MIEHNGVRLEPGRLVERILTVVAFADNLMAFTARNHPDRQARYRVTIDQQHFQMSALKP